MKKLTGKTVRKLYRLCRELEEANGVRVMWGVFPFEGRSALYFYLKPRKNTDHSWMDFLTTGLSFSIGEALQDFYTNLTNLLSVDRFSEEDIQRYHMPTIADYEPGRFERRAYSTRGLHAKRVQWLGKGRYYLESLTAGANGVK